MANIAGMKHLGKVVRRVRKLRNLTLEEVANQVPEYDAGNLSRFERGLQDIAMAKLETLAVALSTPMHELIHQAQMLDDGITPLVEYPVTEGQPARAVANEAHARYSGLHQGVTRMAVLSDSQAASLSESSEALTSAKEFIETTEELGAQAFAWRVKDDSMTGDAGALSFPVGVTVIFKQVGSHAAGDCVLVRISPTEVVFCQLVRAGGAWFMSSLNKRYPPTALPETGVVLGVAVAAQFKVPRGGASQ